MGQTAAPQGGQTPTPCILEQRIHEAGRGKGDAHLTASPIPAPRRRRADFRLRRSRPSWLRPQLVEDRSQGPNTIAEGVLGSTDELDQLDGQDGFFLVGQVKVLHRRYVVIPAA